MSTSTTAKKKAPSLLSSLPNDIVLNILARVPRRYHPILSCVSKNLTSLVRCCELHKTRSLLGKDCFYVRFEDIDSNSLTRHWFTLTENRCLAKVSIPFPSPPERYCAALMVGSEIYFFSGFWGNHYPSRRMWILDSWSRKLREGPSMLASSRAPAVGLDDDKIYIFGGVCEEGYDEIQAQVFDLKTKTWQIAANPSEQLYGVWMSVVTPSLDRKIYAKCGHVARVYDTRDGNLETIRLPADSKYCSKDVCVIDNVLYTFIDLCLGGLMWYNSKDKEWRAVSGLNLNEYSFLNLTIAEYNGKLAFLWRKYKKMEIWCAMISLRRRGLVEVQGPLEWSNCILSDVPPGYKISHCLGRTD